MRVATMNREPATAATDVDGRELREMLAMSGVVLLPGLDVDDRSFAELTTILGDRFSCDPAKIRGTRLQRRSDAIGEAARKIANTIDKLPSQISLRRSNGTRAAPFQPYGINPHNENTYIPGAFPDLVWFYCERPAADGGATLLCDAVAAYAALPDRAKEFIEQNPLRFEMTYRAANWQNLYDLRSTEELRAILDEVSGLSYDISSSGTLHYVFDPLQHSCDNPTGEKALRTNMLSRRPFGQVGDNEREFLPSGDPLPAWLVDDVLTTVQDQTISLDLAAGDVIVIDNRRVMHGRTPFTDTNRRILTRCGWLAAA